MKKIILGLIAALSCAYAGGAVARADDAVDWALRYRLVHAERAEDLAHIYNDVDLSDGSPRTGDLLVEYLLRVAADPGLDGHEAADMVAALGRRPGARWRAALQKIRELEAPVLLRAAAFDYVSHHPAGGEEYSPGSIDLGQLRAADDAAALAVVPTDERARKLGTLKTGDAPRTLLAAIGPPQSARLAQVANVRRILLYYRGAGRVVLGSLKTSDWRVQNSTAHPLLFEMEMPYRARAAELSQPDDAQLRMMLVATGRPIALKLTLQDAFDGAVTLEYLDTVAEWLAQNWKHADDGSADTVSWAVRVLRARGGPRYDALVHEVRMHAPSQKVRNYARVPAPAHRPSAVPSTPYVPGTVSLADVARKHPGLYPDVTFTSGQL